MAEFKGTRRMARARCRASGDCAWSFLTEPLPGEPIGVMLLALSPATPPPTVTGRLLDYATAARSVVTCPVSGLPVRVNP
jgi:hypothetical protein